MKSVSLLIALAAAKTNPKNIPVTPAVEPLQPEMPVKSDPVQPVIIEPITPVVIESIIEPVPASPSQEPE